MLACGRAPVLSDFHQRPPADSHAEYPPRARNISQGREPSKTDDGSPGARRLVPVDPVVGRH
jgi:hypothetical protein